MISKIKIKYMLAAFIIFLCILVSSILYTPHSKEEVSEIVNGLSATLNNVDNFQMIDTITENYYDSESNNLEKIEIYSEITDVFNVSQKTRIRSFFDIKEGLVTTREYSHIEIYEINEYGMYDSFFNFEGRDLAPWIKIDKQLDDIIKTSSLSFDEVKYIGKETISDIKCYKYMTKSNGKESYYWISKDDFVIKHENSFVGSNSNNRILETSYFYNAAEEFNHPENIVNDDLSNKPSDDFTIDKVDFNSIEIVGNLWNGMTVGYYDAKEYGYKIIISSSTNFIDDDSNNFTILESVNASYPQISLDKKSIAYINNTNFEEYGNLNIFNCDQYTLETITDFNHIINSDGSQDETIKDIEWIDQNQLLAIIGPAFGTVSRGGDIYYIDLECREMNLLLKASDFSDSNNYCEYTDIYLDVSEMSEELLIMSKIIIWLDDAQTNYEIKDILLEFGNNWKNQLLKSHI